MIWQDIVIGTGQCIFVLSEIVAVLHPDKPNKYTAAMTFPCLYAFSIAFWSMGLWLSFAGSVLGGVGWTVLFVQKVMQERRNSATY